MRFSSLAGIRLEFLAAKPSNIDFHLAKTLGNAEPRPPFFCSISFGCTPLRLRCTISSSRSGSNIGSPFERPHFGRLIRLVSVTREYSCVDAAKESSLACLGLTRTHNILPGFLLPRSGGGAAAPKYKAVQTRSKKPSAEVNWLR